MHKIYGLQTPNIELRPGRGEELISSLNFPVNGKETKQEKDHSNLLKTVHTKNLWIPQGRFQKPWLSYYHDCLAGGLEGRGIRRLALTLSNNCSRVAFSFGRSPRCCTYVSCDIGKEGGLKWPYSSQPSLHLICSPVFRICHCQCVDRRFLFLAFLLLPFGSASAGRTSDPQMDQAAAAVTIPAKPFVNHTM